MTFGKQEMIENTRSDLERWVERLKENPDELLRTPFSLYTVEELHEIYKGAPVSLSTLGRVLSEIIGKANMRGRKNKSRVRDLLIEGKPVSRPLYMVRKVKELQGMTETQLARRFNQERGAKPDSAKTEEEKTRERQLRKMAVEAVAGTEQPR